MLTLAFTIRTATHKHIQHDVRQCHLKFDAHAHACTRTHNLHAGLYCRAHATARARACTWRNRSIALTERSCSFVVFFFFHPNTSSQEKELRGEYCRAEHFLFIYFVSPCSNSTCTPWLCREICQCFHYFEFFFFSPCVFECSREWLWLLRYALYMMCITAPHAAEWLQRNPRNSFAELCCQRGEDIKGGSRH